MKSTLLSGSSDGSAQLLASKSRQQLNDKGRNFFMVEWMMNPSCPLRSKKDGVTSKDYFCLLYTSDAADEL